MQSPGEREKKMVNMKALKVSYGQEREQTLRVR